MGYRYLCGIPHCFCTAIEDYGVVADCRAMKSITELPFFRNGERIYLKKIYMAGTSYCSSRRREFAVNRLLTVVCKMSTTTTMTPTTTESTTTPSTTSATTTITYRDVIRTTTTRFIIGPTTAGPTRLTSHIRTKDNVNTTTTTHTVFTISHSTTSERKIVISILKLVIPVSTLLAIGFIFYILRVSVPCKLLCLI